MVMESMVAYVHRLLLQQQCEIAVDFTMGNGGDTLVLSKIANIVHSFDIQDEAMQVTNKKIQEEHIKNVQLHKDSHLHFDRYIPSFDVGVFNLGYLPGGKHCITTMCPCTLLTLQKALDALRPGGHIYIVIYTGHPEGQKEGEAITSFVSALDLHVYSVDLRQILNKKQAPYCITIEKSKKANFS